MAAVESMGLSSLGQSEPQTLTEISDDEINLQASEDEEEEAAGVAEKESAEEEFVAEAVAASSGDDALKLDMPVNGVMVLSLLDKIIGAVDQIQKTQTGLEARQQDMERSVNGIQGELAKLAKSHGNTSNSVNKMMEKVQKVSVNVKTVRANLEKQGGQIRKLETNEAELLKRRNFKVMVYQDDVKVQSRLSVSKSLKVPGSMSGSRGGSLLELKEEEQGEDGEGEKVDKPHVELSSDEEDLVLDGTIEETRTERIKRSSLQRVQNLKTVFSKEKIDKTRAKTIENLGKTRDKTRANLEKTKQKTKLNMEKTRENLEKTRQKTRENLEKTRHNIEKKVGKLGTRMSVNAEQKQKMQTSRDKVKKSFTPDHVVYARDKTAVYKVPPFTFHVKKVREGAVEVVQGTEMVEVSQEAEAFQEVDAEVEEGGVELEMEMMNGGEEAEEDEDLDEDEEEVTQDNKDLDSD
ncbi:caveolae-associated protein 1b [Gadus chalcogrammus]|uniref:caveolae-associated protein 1b n=1 Tax=Gadus chalcogrammus TaxID=1042646 RepID=UPI0024C4A584|nr:caveolae-associated protein 1b [Gadus chalcogrammus]